MAVARASSGTQNSSSGGSYVTSINHSTFTVSAGSDLVLYAVVTWDDTAVTGQSVTWNSVSMTEIASVNNAGGRNYTKLYRLINPAAGTQTLAASWSSPSIAVSVGLAAFSGVDQTTPEVGGDTLTASGTSTSPSTGAVTSSANDATFGVVGAGTLAGTAAVSATGGGMTEEFRQSGAEETAVAGSTGLGGSSNTHSWTLGASVQWGAIGVHIKAAGGGGGTALKAFMAGDLSGVGAPGRFFKDRLQ